MRESRFVALLYLLVRDELPAGTAERLVDRLARDEVGFSDARLLEWCRAQEDRLPVYRMQIPTIVDVQVD